MVAHPEHTAVLGDVISSARLVRRFRRSRSEARQRAAVVEAVFALAAELRAGRTPAQALHRVSQSVPSLDLALAAAAAAVRSGAPPAGELRRVAALPGCAGLHGVAAAWHV